MTIYGHEIHILGVFARVFSLLPEKFIMIVVKSQSRLKIQIIMTSVSNKIVSTLQSQYLTYRDRLKSMQILLSRTQPEPVRTGKQEQ